MSQPKNLNQTIYLKKKLNIDNFYEELQVIVMNAMSDDYRDKKNYLYGF